MCVVSCSCHHSIYLLAHKNYNDISDYCLQCLPPLMRQMAETERDNQYRLSRETMDAVPFLSEDLKYHPRDFCKWAYQIVFTRAVETEDGDLKLVPMAGEFH